MSQDAVYIKCPDCKGTGKGPHNIGTWCEKCRQYEHGYYPTCKRCGGEKYVRRVGRHGDR